MSEHTPGPWFADYAPNGWHIYVESTRRFHPALDRDVFDDVNIRTNGDNARLVAAAPDTDSKARAVCLAWAEGDNDKMQAALLALFLHLFGQAPVVAEATGQSPREQPDQVQA